MAILNELERIASDYVRGLFRAAVNGPELTTRLICANLTAHGFTEAATLYVASEIAEQDAARGAPEASPEELWDLTTERLRLWRMGGLADLRTDQRALAEQLIRAGEKEFGDEK